MYYVCLGGAVDSVLACHACDWCANHVHGKSHCTLTYTLDNIQLISDESLC